MKNLFLIILIISFTSINIKSQIQKDFKLGFDVAGGFSIPYSLRNSEVFGTSYLIIGEYGIWKSYSVFSLFSFIGSKPDRSVIAGVYKDIWNGKETKIEYDNSYPLKIYSYAAGIIYRQNALHGSTGFRFGCGIVFNQQKEDMYKIIDSTSTITIPVFKNSSIGLNLLVAYDIPVYKEIILFSPIINISTSIMSFDKSINLMQYSSFCLGIHVKLF